MKQLLHILKYIFLAYIRFDSRPTAFSLLKSIGSGFIFSAFAVAAFLFSNELIGFLLKKLNLGQFLLHEFLSIILFIFFVSINIGNIIVSYSTLYRSLEVNYLLTKPIHPSKIFTLKFLDNFFYSSSTLLMILFAILLGYAFYFGLSATQFLIIVLNFIPFMISAGSIGVILLLLVILLANRLGVKTVIYTFGAIYFSAVLFYFKVNSPKQLVRTVLHHYPFVNRDLYLDNLVPSVLKYLPNNWLSQTAYWVLHESVEKILFYSLMQFCLAAFLFTIAYLFGRRFYFKTWMLNLKLTAEFSSKRNNVKPFYRIENDSITSQLKTIFRKDFLTFIREPSQLIHAIILSFLLLIFIGSVAGMKFVGLGNFYLQTMIYLAIFVFNLLLITTLSLRFVFPIISLEGQAFWKIKSAPISILKYLKSKLFAFGSLILAISFVLSLFSNYKFGFTLIAFSLMLTLISTITIISINFGMGCLFANYKEKNPIRLSSSQGATLSFLICIAYMVFLVVLLFKPFSSLFLSIMINKSYYLVKLFYYLTPMLFLSIFIVWVYYKVSVSSMKRDF